MSPSTNIKEKRAMDQPLNNTHPYSQQCQAAILRCYEGHEPQDVQYLKSERSYSDVQAEVESLRREANMQVLNSLSMISISLVSFDKFERFLKMSVQADLETAVMWSSISLMIGVYAQEEQAVSRLSRSLKGLGHKIDLHNTYCGNDTTLYQLREAAIDIFVEVLNFNSSAIQFLRSTAEYERTNEATWRAFSIKYDSAAKSIDEVLQRVEKHTRYATHVEELQRLQMFLSLTPTNFTNSARLPCSNLPVARNARFYDRNNIIDKIDKHFFENPEDQRFRTLALFGLGGVGKSHVALKYSHGKTSVFPAILWIRSETKESLEGSFSEIASRLKLEGAEPQKHEENRILVLDWLQKTSCKWLLIFDNAESLDLLLRYWPVADQGCALVTTRNHALAFEPAEAGIEILPFDRAAGSGFILHLLSRDIAADISSQDAKSALDLSEKLSGHALAISQMAGLIHRRSWSIAEFVAIYDRNTREMLGMPGTNSLDAVWRLSFESLNENCAMMLGILCYLMPDSIPQALFGPLDRNDLPATLKFCSHELLLSDVVDDLLTLALIKRDRSTRTLSLHRLVQNQFRYFVSASQNQTFFDATTCLLFEAFPQSDSKKGQLYDRWTQCQLYLQHVLSLKRVYKEASNSDQPLQPSLKFCKLLKSLSRFLLESALYLELEDSLDAARSAFTRLKLEEQDQELLSDLCASSGLMWAHRGLFSLAEPLQREAHRIRSQAEPLDRLELSWTEVNMGNLVASTNKYEESLEWQIKALRNRQIAGGDDYSVMKPQGLLYQNLGRSKHLVGSFNEAHIWCHIAIRVLADSQNWAMLAYTHFVLGNLNRAENNLVDAKKEYLTAQKVWLERGQMRTHHFNGACIYKLGCVAFDQGDREAAIKHLRESLIIAQLHKEALTGDYARVLHKLSVVLGSQAGNETEAVSKAKEARAIAVSRNTAGQDAEIDDEERAYDDLVYILWR